MRTCVITAPSDPIYDRGQGVKLTHAGTPKMPSPCLHPLASFAPMCNAF